MRTGGTAMNSRMILAAAALALLPGLAGCVTVAEFRKLEYEVNKLRAERTGNGPQASRVADLNAEVEVLRGQVAALEGRIQESDYRASSALEEAQQARLEAAGAPPAGIAPTGEPLPGAVLPGDPSGGPATSAAPAGSISQELASYREAYDAWRTDDNEACVDRFGQFLQTYPSSEYADDAAYWMADCYFKQGDFRNAVLRFDDVVRTYPSSDKAAEALYRQGEALLRLNHEKAAETAFQRVINDYPGSARAAEARRQLDLLGAG